MSNKVTAPRHQAAKEITVPRTDARHNVLVILVDDAGADMLAQYQAWQIAKLGYAASPIGHPYTPNLGTLASEGIKFYNAFAQPVCSPTRANLLTGRYSARTGTGNVVMPDYATSSYDELGGKYSAEIGYPKFVTPKGYRSLACGKWHMALPTTAIDSGAAYTGSGWTHPTDMGFDTFRGVFTNLNKPPMPASSGSYDPGYYNFYWYESDADDLSAEPQQKLAYNTNWSRQRLQQWINTQGGEPWLAYWAINAPHSPYGDAINATSTSGCMPPEQYTNSAPGTYDPVTMPGAVWDSVRAAVENIDWEIGQLRANLGEEVWGRTTVIFMGDNGSDGVVLNDALDAGEANFGDYEDVITATSPSRLKTSVYSAGTRIPLIISGPLVRNPGRESYALVDAVDIFATIRRITRSTYDDAIFDSRTIDGVDLYDVLADATGADAAHRTFSFSERYIPNGLPNDITNTADLTHSGINHVKDRVYRKWRSDGIWHLVRRLVGTSNVDELYHVQDNSNAPLDMNEQTNLAGSETAVLTELRLDLQALQSAMNSDQW